jgi:hypothetical protein
MKKEKNENKGRPITIRLSADEYEKVLKNSQKTGQKNLSEYARKCLLHQKIQVETIDISVQNFVDRINFYTTQLKKIGQNFNQVVRYLQAKHSPEETEKLLSDARIELENANKNCEYVVQIADKIERYYVKK